jgi:hypothetical protein
MPTSPLAASLSFYPNTPLNYSRPTELYPEAMRLDCAMLYVKDFPHMKEFYEQMLGTPPLNTEWTDTWALFDVGSARFALHAIPAEYARNIQLSFLPKVAEGTRNRPGEAHLRGR